MFQRIGKFGQGWGKCETPHMYFYTKRSLRIQESQSEGSFALGGPRVQGVLLLTSPNTTVGRIDHGASCSEADSLAASDCFVTVEHIHNVYIQANIRK